ncbi:restriction endonuclease subunit S [Marinobacter sp. 1-3A]|uniref:restriction endonuclease subunit S n=1 Tax=Marinobacter sp. 1-3A TaxID=2582920 RepID=UPI0019089A78|nr:restriction endonuclease subunit S [Marinobacter sp. 1-3A]MBK1872512.1 restriction endonuclease subunit S [Marinobacter sp. 1-3A]
MAEHDIPDGWIQAKISEISIKGLQRKPATDESFTYVDIGSIDRSLKAISAPQVISGDSAPSRARKVIENGDVLVSLTRPNLNAVALVDQKFHNQIASTGFEVIKPVLVDSRYIFALVRSKTFIDQISGVVQGALYPAAKSSDVQNFEFPLPPLAEQKVIADKLDTLLAQEANTKARLERIPQILKRFRQSMLAAAVSGRLTEEWSCTNVELREIAEFQNGYAFKSGWFENSGTHQVVKLGNIRDGHIALENSPAYVGDELAKEFSRYAPSPGDILISMTGTRFKKDYGFGCMIKDEKNLLINQRVGRVIPDRAKVSPEYLSLFVRSDVFRDQFFDGETGGVNQGNVGSKHILSILIELPTIDIQRGIVRRVDQLFAHADRIEQQVNSALARVNNLTQSILAKAFRGELTEQWRKDNPELISGENSAEALLERVKAERATMKPIKKPRKKATS